MADIDGMDVIDITESIQQSLEMVNHYLTDPGVYLRHTEEEVLDHVGDELANIHARHGQLKYILRYKRKEMRMGVKNS